MFCSEPCPLCGHSHIEFYHQDTKRHYWQCLACDLVFVDSTQRPSLLTEKSEYDLHQNTPEDEGYIRFLSRVSEPLLAAVERPAKGLDFGCGPTPVLSMLLNQSGLATTYYDPIYYPDESYLHCESSLDFIVCTEAIEHFHNPHIELAKLDRILKPHGLLAIMTKRVLSKEKFKNWHYKNDQTHVSFFSLKTFEFIADRFQYTLDVVSADVVFLRKRATQ